MKKPLLFLLLFAIIIVSCKKENTEEPIVYKDIQPLRVGYNWTYIDSLFNEEGSCYGVDTTTLIISGNEIIDYEGSNVEIFHWQWTYDNAFWLVSSEDHSRYTYGMGINVKSFVVERTCEVKYPIEIGGKWQTIWFGLDDEPHWYCYAGQTVVNECLNTEAVFNTLKGDLICQESQSEYIEDQDLYKVKVYNCPEKGYVGLVAYKNGKKYFSKRLLDMNLTIMDNVVLNISKHYKGINNIHGKYGVRLDY